MFDTILLYGIYEIISIYHIYSISIYISSIVFNYLNDQNKQTLVT